VEGFAASAEGYVYPPLYYHDVENHVLPFKEVKHCHLEQALQQFHDRNGPAAINLLICYQILLLHLSEMMTISPFLILEKAETRWMIAQMGTRLISTSQMMTIAPFLILEKVETRCTKAKIRWMMAQMVTGPISTSQQRKRRMHVSILSLNKRN
jgi:hypothetical protein